MTVFIEPNNLGDLLKYEAPNLYSREEVTVTLGQKLALGTVLGRDDDTGEVRQLNMLAVLVRRNLLFLPRQQCVFVLLDLRK